MLRWSHICTYLLRYACMYGILLRVLQLVFLSRNDGIEKKTEILSLSELLYDIKR